MLVSIVRLLVIFLCVTQCLAAKILSQSISAKPAAGLRKGRQHYEGNDGKDGNYDDSNCGGWDCDGDDDDDDDQDDDDGQESSLYTTERYTTEVPVSYEVLVTTSVNGKLTTITHHITTELHITTFITDPVITSSKTNTATTTTTTTTSDITISTDVISSITTIVTSTTTTSSTTSVIPPYENVGCYMYDTNVEDVGEDWAMDNDFVGDENTFEMYLKQEKPAMTVEMCYYSCTQSAGFSGVSVPWYVGIRGVALLQDMQHDVQMMINQCFCMKATPTLTATTCYSGDNGILYGNGDPAKGDFSIAVLRVNS